jgi:predicted 2-oxoglutarate/Fe(II)-dependent dioxygenase YbiX
MSFSPTGAPIEAVGLNERLRFLKYGPGDYFKPHTDGCYVRPDGKERSFVTLQLYLNSGTDLGDHKEGDFVGGATTFLVDDTNVPCVPRAGRVLIFQHNIRHEDSLINRGTKYVVRTDIMYRS